MSEQDWKATRLKKGDYMFLEASVEFPTLSMSVLHMDRTIDPYLASVVQNGIVIYTGLHVTLADARNKCKEYLK